MLIEQAIYILLRDSADVGAIAGDRIFGGQLRQTVNYPAIAYRTTGGRRVTRQWDGGCALVEQGIHIFSAALGEGKSGTAARLDMAVHKALDEFYGTVTDDTVSPEETIDIQGIFSTNISHEYYYDDPTVTHQFVSEFMVHFLDPQRL